jgi:hypothetical protein
MDDKIPKATVKEIDNKACGNSNTCDLTCARKGRQNSPLWFGAWIDGTAKEDCEFRQLLRDDKLLLKLFEDF